MVDDLVAFLRARLDEDERIAQAAFDPKHPGEWVWRKDSRTTVRTTDGIPIEPAPPGIERGPHIAQWHPARVIREVKAKRQMLEQFEAARTPLLSNPPYWLLPLLAVPYAGHPAYDERWRPE